MMNSSGQTTTQVLTPPQQIAVLRSIYQGLKAMTIRGEDAEDNVSMRQAMVQVINSLEQSYNQALKVIKTSEESRAEALGKIQAPVIEIPKALKRKYKSRKIVENGAAPSDA